MTAKTHSRDPRLYQVAVLTTLLVYGLTVLDFGVGLAQVVVTLVVALATQWCCGRLWKLPAFDPRSPLISGLSLCLLFRCNHLGLAAAAAVITIASKFLFRSQKRHFFNPTNFGIVVMLVLSGTTWVSPGQWGNAALVGFLMACVGGMVVNRALRSDVTYAFLLGYAALLFGRSLWLNEPMSIPLHRMQSGALLLFAFFMISDPKTTPDARAGRIVFGLLVALGTAFVHFYLFRNNGMFYSLVVVSCLTPLLNRVLPGKRFEWSSRSQESADRNWPDVTPGRRRGLQKATVTSLYAS